MTFAPIHSNPILDGRRAIILFALSIVAVNGRCAESFHEQNPAFPTELYRYLEWR